MERYSKHQSLNSDKYIIMYSFTFSYTLILRFGFNFQFGLLLSILGFFAFGSFTLTSFFTFNFVLFSFKFFRCDTFPFFLFSCLDVGNLRFLLEFISGLTSSSKIKNSKKCRAKIIYLLCNLFLNILAHYLHLYRIFLVTFE